MRYGSELIAGMERRRWRSRAVRRAGRRIHNTGGAGGFRLLFKLCLAAALAAEAAWFWGAAVHVTRFRQIEERQAPATEPGSAGSGIHIRLEDGEIDLFKVEEYSLPGND